MHDFKEIFKDQLANEQPWTQGTVRSSLQMHSFRMTARELMEKSKELKTKIGKRRLRYYTNQPGTTDLKMNIVWEDEFDALQVKLADHMFAGHDGLTPKFTKAYE